MSALPVASLAVSAGLGAALSLGVADFAAQRLTVRYGWVRALLVAQLSSLPLIAGSAMMLEPLPSWTTASVGGLLATGLLYAVGIGALYGALARGPLTIVSPIASSFAAVTVALSLCVGQSLPQPRILGGLALILIGVVLAARGDRSAPAHSAPAGASQGGSSGALWAVVSSVTMGAAFLGIELTSHHAGRDTASLWPLVAMRAITSALLLVLWFARRGRDTRSLSRPRTSRLLWLGGFTVGALDSLGMVLYTLGLAVDHVAVVVVLTSLFSVVTVALARIWLREQLTTTQWVAVALIVCGIAWTSLSR